MEKLGDRNYALIYQGVKSEGSYDPNLIMCYFEEQLYVDEANTVRDFLQWCHDTNTNFGSGNYEIVFSQFCKATGVVLDESIFDKAVKHVQETYCDAHISTPYMLLGDVADLIKLTTGKEVDWKVLAKHSRKGNWRSLPEN